MKTKVWAHRGASAYAPENTMIAFEKAVQMGADGIELDVQMTKDEQLVVIHDETINRTSNGRGYVSSYTLDELRKYNFNNGFKTNRIMNIPTLEEVYEYMKTTSLTINVELKNNIMLYKGMEEKLLELAKNMKIEEQIIYSSFNRESIAKIKELAPCAKSGILYTATARWQEIESYAKQMGITALHPSFKAAKEKQLIQSAKENSLDLHVWTVNKGREMAYLVMKQVEAIITDKPDICRQIVRNFSIGKPFIYQ